MDQTTPNQPRKANWSLAIFFMALIATPLLLQAFWWRTSFWLRHQQVPLVVTRSPTNGFLGEIFALVIVMVGLMLHRFRATEKQLVERGYIKPLVIVLSLLVLTTIVLGRKPAFHALVDGLNAHGYAHCDTVVTRHIRGGDTIEDISALTPVNCALFKTRFFGHSSYDLNTVLTSVNAEITRPHYTTDIPLGYQHVSP